MKTIIPKHPWHACGHSPRALCWTRATVLSAFLLATAKLAALPSVSTISGGPSYGFVNGNTATAAKFHTPVGLALNTAGNFLYIADRDNNAIRRLDLSGNNTTTFATASISKPVGVAVDTDGNVYVVNRGTGNNGTVLQFDSFGHLLATKATGLVNANGIALDGLTNVYVTVANTVLQITPGGVQTTVATITTANSVLKGIAVEGSGLLAVCDSGLNGIWLIDPTTGNPTALTGFNGAGEGFGGPAFAKFNQPYGIAAAGNGILVVADYGNNRVKVVDASGTVTNLYGVDSTFWVTGPGTYPGWWDGAVGLGDNNFNTYGYAESRLPAGVFFASDGSVYTTEDYYHLIRKVTGTGLPQPPPPPPPVPAPRIGWVAFTIPPADIVSVLQVNQPFIFNNDVIIAIQGTDGTETHYTYGPTPVGLDTIPNPTPTSGGTPPYYRDGMFPGQVPPSIVAPQPDMTIKAIGSAPGRQGSGIVSARFQFKVGNPTIWGNNAAMFSVSNITENAAMWYTLDGSDPTGAPPSIGPIISGTSLSVGIVSNITFKIRGFKTGYQASDIVPQTFSISNYNANKISFGFESGEASSDFVASPGQLFYAPVTLSLLQSTKMYSLQFNLTVTNAGPNPGPPVTPGAYSFTSFLMKPIPGINPPVFEPIPPLMFSGYATNPPPAGQIVTFDNRPAFINLTITNSSINLLGVGWLERFSETNLYNTLAQDLVTFSQPHDTTFLSSAGKVVAGGYAFQVPGSAAAGQTYQIKVGRPSATSDGIGAPGSDVFISTPTNGSLAAGIINSIKNVTVGQRKYIAGDCYPFRWFNAGDFGDTNLDNPDVEQVFQSAVYGLNAPPDGSDFFDSMDSCGTTYIDLGHGYLESNASISGNTSALNALFDGNDTTINQIAFGDGTLDVCDVYVTFRRSLDPSLTWFRRFWTNGVRVAEITAQPTPAVEATPLAKSLALWDPTNAPTVNFFTKDVVAAPGQTLQIPITAQVFGDYPLRVLMLNLTVAPLDGSPALTSPVQFAPVAALGQPTITSSDGNGNYAATWLDSTIAGLSGTATIGTLTVRIPANASSSAAYAVHFDHASASPNGIASFPKHTLTGLITLSTRSTSVFNDGIPDSWRLRYFGTVNNLLSQAAADADGDGASNWQEYIAGTDPLDAKSCLRLASGLGSSTGTAQPALAGQTKDYVLRWPSIAGKQYVIERSMTLFTPTWTPLATNIGTGTDMEFHDTTGGQAGFYRVHVAP